MSVRSPTARPILQAHVAGVRGPLRLDVRFETHERVLALVGPNGAGKSTVLAALLGAAPALAQRVVVAERVLADATQAISVPIEARRLGYLPQDAALFSHCDVRGNLALALELARVPSTDRAARIERVCDELGLGALLSRAVHALSGGERQRVALARALVIEPVALLLDEPLAALDARGRAEVLVFLRRVFERHSVPAIVVTHDATDVHALEADVLVLEEGRVVQHGRLDELSRAPASAFVEAFVARILATR